MECHLGVPWLVAAYVRAVAAFEPGQRRPPNFASAFVVVAPWLTLQRLSRRLLESLDID